MAKALTPNQIRCQDCDCLKMVNGVECCSECFNQKIADIDDCPNGITAEEVMEINAKAAENKVKNVVRSKTGTPRKPKERKPDVEKEEIIFRTADFLRLRADSVKITNISKIIEFDIGENHYKFDLIRQRKPKNQ